MSTQLTERQFFILSLSGLLGILFAMYYFLLHPAIMDRRMLKEEIEKKTTELTRAGYLMGEQPLLEQKFWLDQVRRDRMNEWKKVSDALTADPITDSLATNTSKIIDYKYERHRIAGSLRRKARDIEIPLGLGISEKVYSDEELRVRVQQLIMVEKLVDIAIKHNIADIKAITPLPPIPYTIGKGRGAEIYIEEYPLIVVFEGPMERLYKLWEGIFQPRDAMLIRNIAMNKVSLERNSDVNMQATLSSIVFVTNPEEMKLIQTEFQKAPALGH